VQHQYATFKIGTGLFGIDVLLIREINRNLDITEVNPAPDFVRGLLNLRGQIVTVIDPGTRLGIERRSLDSSSCCVVLKTSQEIERMRDEGLLAETTHKDTVALLVDGIGDMVNIDDRAIEHPPANINGIDSSFISGIVKLDSELLVIMKLEKILEIAV
jgi:purine-binding chemotaxis protein CheW